MRPSRKREAMARMSPSVRSRDTASMVTGQSAKRSEKVSKCCCASRVVGASTATWRPLATARNAARIATSVLPKPTSPQIRRSVASVRVRSAITVSMAASWSGVAANGNCSTKRR